MKVKIRPAAQEKFFEKDISNLQQLDALQLNPKDELAFADGGFKKVKEWSRRELEGLFAVAPVAPAEVSARATPPEGGASAAASTEALTKLTREVEELRARLGAMPGVEADLRQTRAELSTARDQIRRLEEEMGVLSASASTERISTVVTEQANALERRTAERVTGRLDAVVSNTSERVNQEINRIENQVRAALAQSSEMLEGLQAEAETVRLRADERRAFVQRYFPGRIDALQQELEQVGERLLRAEEKNRKLEEARAKLELDLLRQRASGNELTLEQLQAREKLLEEREARVASAEMLKLQNEQLLRDAAEFDRIRHQYEIAHSRAIEDENLRTRVAELTSDRTVIADERDRLRQELRGNERRLAQLHAAEERSRNLSQRNSELEDALRGASIDVEAERVRLATAREALRADRSALDGRERELSLRETNELRRLEELRQQALRSEEHRLRLIEAREARLETEVRERVRAEHETEVAALRSQVESVPFLGRQVTELRARLDEALREEAEFNAAQAMRAAEVAEFTRRRQLLEQSVTSLDEQVRQLAAVREELTAYQAQLTVAREEEAGRREAAQRAIDDLLARRQSLEDRTTSRTARLKPIREPWSKELVPPLSSHAEGVWLDDLEQRIARAGFWFPRRLVEAFHTSLKIGAWAPLTALSGVSGTGKSELPRLYATFGGLRFLSVPVQPNWDSPQDLFGFFNYMDGQFRATDLIRAIHQAQREEAEQGFPNGLLLVLMDEMNRARFELYFSELLSRLESRRGATSFDERSITVDLGAGIEQPERVALGDNLLFVGTMNEDESTHSLSDMVLDRGNVISFPRPRRLQRRDTITRLDPRGGFLTLANWRLWQREPASLQKEVRDTLSGVLTEINQALAHVNRAVGHRVLQAVEAYVANHPAMTCGELKETSYQRPLEDQLAQKVIPKLRGIETESRAGRACLDAIVRITRAHAPALAADLERSRDTSEGSFTWTSGSYLDDPGSQG